jgi:acyl-CoA dehydrogenase
VRRRIFEAEHDDLRDSVRAFLAKEAVPHTERWEAAGMVDRSFWERAAANGLVGFEAPSEYGGANIRDFRFNSVITEEVTYAAVAGDGFMLENDIIAPYLIDHTNDEQKQRWLPGFTCGRLVVAIAMSEPGAGSDLRAISTSAVLDGDRYVLNGSKTFVTSGIQADLVIVVARTAGPVDDRGDNMSLLVVEDQMEGFTRGRKLEKVGRRAQDTAVL